MTDKRFIREISKKNKIPQKTIHRVLDAVEVELKNRFLETEEPIKVCDIVFYVKIHGKHWGRNMRTGERQIVNPVPKLKIKMSRDWTELFRYRNNDKILK